MEKNESAEEEGKDDGFNLASLPRDFDFQAFDKMMEEAEVAVAAEAVAEGKGNQTESWKGGQQMLVFIPLPWILVWFTLPSLNPVGYKSHNHRPMDYTKQKITNALGNLCTVSFGYLTHKDTTIYLSMYI